MSLFQNIYKKIIRALYDQQPVPLTGEIGQLAEEFKEETRRVCQETISGNSQVQSEWADNLKRLCWHIDEGDLSSFLRWDIIQQTMFVDSPAFVKKELNYLQNSPEWRACWAQAILESPVGRPLPCVYYPKSSGNAITHAYQLAQLEKKTRKKIKNTKVVFEFGGGYGSMCRLIHNLHFSGQYIIYDLPLFSALQKFFLKANGIKIISLSDFQQGKSGVVCISDPGGLKKLFTTELWGASVVALFIATWSLSEAPIKIRQEIIPLLANFNNYLIGYQKKFGEVDNVAYFRSLQKNNECADIDWHEWEIEHLPNNYYLMGSSLLD